MPSSHKFKYEGEGDHEPGKEPGDVVIQLEEKPHHLFQRHGKDITMKMDITLSEALCGLKKVIKTLDNRDITFKTSPGEVIKHGDLKMILDEGFPTHRDPFSKGRLIIVFNVIFPDSLTEEAAKKIASGLPKVPKPNPSPDAEEVKIIEFDGQGSWKGGEEQNGDADDDDEEQGAHGFHSRAQQCHTQWPF